MSGTFVSVGNAKQSFSRLLEAVVKISHLLPKPILIQHGHTSFISKDHHLVAFMEMDDFAKNVTDAAVLIMHAGAGSVIHAIRADKLPIIMPRRSNLGEHIDDHQLEFAETLAKSGKIILAETSDELLNAVKKSNGENTIKSESEEPLMLKMIKDELDKLATRHC